MYHYVSIHIHSIQPATVFETLSTFGDSQPRAASCTRCNASRFSVRCETTVFLEDLLKIDQNPLRKRTWKEF